MKYFKLIFATIFILSTFSCSDSRIFDDVKNLASDEWPINEKISFSVNIADTTSAHDILVHIRNSNSYTYSNLWMFIETSTPNGVQMRDTVEFILADNSGEWIGKGWGSINSRLIPYKLNIRFPYRGVYNFSFQQAMRQDILHGIKDVGLRVQKHQ